MSVNPSPIKRAFICPLCGTPIDAMTPEETAYAPAPKDWVPTSDDERQNRAEFAIAQNMEANEALIWAHFESHHNLREAVMALGTARQALFDIANRITATSEVPGHIAVAIHELAERGLGNL